MCDLYNWNSFSSNLENDLFLPKMHLKTYVNLVFAVLGGTDGLKSQGEKNQVLYVSFFQKINYIGMTAYIMFS